MNTPEHDDWERLFRQRLSDLEAQPPADALARILAAANSTPAPITYTPGSAARTLGVGGMVVLLLGVWLMQATQRPQQHVLAEPINSSRETIASATSNRPTENASFTKNKRERDAAMKPGTAATKLNRVLETVGAPAELNKSPEPQNQLAHSDRWRKPTQPITLSDESKGAAKPVTPSGFSVNKNRIVHSASVPRRGFLAKPDQAVTQHPVSRLNPKMIPANVLSTTKKQSSTSQSDSYYQGIPITRSTTEPINPETSKSIALAFNQGLAINLLETQRSVLPYQKQVQMAETTPEAQPAAPAVARQRPARAWFVAVTPLYTYQQITPVHTDERYVEQVQTPSTFSGGRAGWQVQIGGEQAINKRFSIRAGLTISELRQSVQYRSRGASFDSARVEVLDNQTIRLTPLYRHQTGQLPGIRRFIGISTVFVWRPFAASAGSNRTWQPYLTAGLSAGQYTGSGGELSGFWQASAGVERAVWPGWWLRLGPSVQYGWHTLTDSPVLTTRPYTYGLTIGLQH